MSKVAVIVCKSYEYSQVKRAVEQGLELLGGAAAFVKPGEKILLKPNLLVGDPPEKCVTTHPAVFKAAGELFQRAGAVLSYGDSPGFGKPEAVARKSGILEAARALHIEMADFVNGEEVSFAGGIQNKRFIIARGALASEGIISLPKFKTHALTRLTGSIKNQFGCIPGILKGEYHVKLPDVNNFAQMLVDLNLFLKPRLFIMDGIMAMEGNGPRGGRPKKMNVLLFSSDPVALDATVCRMIGLEPNSIPTIEAGMKSGLGTCLETNIEILGDDLKQFSCPEFEVQRAPAPTPGNKAVSSIVSNLLIPKPIINAEACIRCGLCIDVCPVQPKVPRWPDGDEARPPVYDYNRCIRCYCCQELCPESAIEVKVPLMRRGLDKLIKG